MAVTVRTVREARFFPESFPAALHQTIPANGEFSPDPLDLRRFGSDRVVQLRNLALDRSSNVQVTLQRDQQSEIYRAVAPKTRVDPVSGSNSPVPDKSRMMAAETLQYQLRNMAGSSVNNYRTHFDVLVDKPTTAHKLALGIPLSPEDNQLIQNYPELEEGVANGLLPYTFEQLKDREYYPVAEFPINRTVDSVPTTGEGAIFEQRAVDPGEALILESISADPGTATQDIQIIIDRDDQVGVAQFAAFPIGGIDFELPLWVPAIREFRLRVLANAAGVSNWNVAMHFRRVKLSNVLKARWGLMDREVDPDTFDRVRAGLL